MLTARELLTVLRGDAAAFPAGRIGGAPREPGLAGSAAMILLLLLPLTVSAVAVDVVLVVLAVMATLGPLRAMQAVALAAVVKLANPALVTQGFEAGLLAWLVLLVAGARVLAGLRASDVHDIGLLWAFAALAALLAAYGSTSVSLSLIKVAAFAWATTTVLAGTRALSLPEIRQLAAWYGALGLVMLVLSLSTLVEPAVAYLINGTGLQGITRHPQTLAILVAPLAAFSATALIVQPRPRWYELAATAAVWVTLAMTEARTGLLAATAGMIGGLMLRVRAANRARGFASSGRIVFVVAAVLATLATLAVQDRWADAVAGFAFKRSGEATLGEAFRQSRGAGIAEQWRNFTTRPMTGHGFGVAAGGTPKEQIVTFAGVPISAPVEKGFLPTAVLEETGIFGALLLLAALVKLGSRAWRNGDPRWLAVFVAAAATNAGEATLLSPGGPGLLLWCVMALAMHAGRTTGVATGPAAGPSPIARRFPNVMR